MGKLLPIIFALIAIGFAWFWFVLLGDLPPIELDENLYWGSASKKGQKDDVSIRPFKININDKILTDLKTRLTLETSADGTRLLPPLEGIGFQYGFNTNQLKTLADYWLKKYDWRAREKLLNKYPQFKTTIAGLELHFQHVKSTNNAKYKVTRPLLLLHGWPGTFVEFQKSIPLLTDPKNSDTNFELIIPSLPGYGFSERAHVPGLGPVEMAQLFNKLMKRIGHEKYYVQGGDWGTLIGTHMATLYPENVKGLHVNFCASLSAKGFLKYFFAAIYPELFMTPEEAKLLYPASSFLSTMIEETGYMHLQSTKPDTVGVGLSNSPIALLAYIGEKFSTWTNEEWRSKTTGGLEAWNLDELLDNIMVYWVTNSITSSQRLYSEGFNIKELSYQIDRVPTAVPAACLQPPVKGFGGHPKFAIQDKYRNLQRYSIAKKGGHFMAFEQPELFTTDVISFFDTLEKSTTFTFNKPSMDAKIK